jgi:archaellum component FlaC
MKSLQDRVQELTGEIENLTKERDKTLEQYCDLDRELIRVRNELERAKTLGLDELRGVVNDLEQSLSRSPVRPR